MFTIKVNGRGRPRGITLEGKATRDRLYGVAISMIGERGYEASKLRDIAEQANVSPALIYKYFNSKQSIVLALYDELSQQYVTAVSTMPMGKWRSRFIYALRCSIAVLAPHRQTLSALTSILVSSGENGLFCQNTAFSRARVMQAFERAVVDASDAPGSIAAALGRLLYLLHLAVIFWWLLDRSRRQSATRGLIALVEKTLPPVSLLLRLPWAKNFVVSLDALVHEGLFPTS